MKIKFRADSQNNLDYLRYLFKAKPGEVVKVTLSDDFGRMAVALYTPSEKRDHQPLDELTVWLRLPRHNTIAGTTGPVEYTDAMQKRLNLILAARFNIELNAYYTKGIAMGIPKQEIIKSFILSRGLVPVENNTNTLTKKTYRNDMAAISERMEQLIEKARYNQQKIEGPGPKIAKKNISLFSHFYR
jgi:hypothetical protein